MAHILPDSRMRRPVGSFPSVHGTRIPVYCANCGAQWGNVPEKYVTFDFCLCDKCEGYGDIAHMYKEPDAIFWERVENEMREVESVQALLASVSDPRTPLGKLAAEWQKKVDRNGRP